MKKKKNYGWWFLLGVILIYLLVGIFRLDVVVASLKFFLLIIKKIILIFVFVFVLMVLINYFISSKKLMKYFGKKAGLKGWIISIVSGLISTGPMYMWYPLLSQMKKKGVKNRFVVAFLYNRAIKLPLLPLLIFYFGWIYVIVLTLVMVVASIAQGIIVEKILEVRK